MKKLKEFLSQFASKSLNIKKNVKIGVVLTAVPFGSGSFNDLILKGISEVSNDFSVDIDYIQNDLHKNKDQILNEYVEKGFELVILSSYVSKVDLQRLSKKYPNTHFVIIDSRIEDLPNVTSIVFRESEGSFLAGALAAMMTKTNTVGFIGAEDLPLINYFKIGYINGAKYINPKVNVKTCYIGGSNPYLNKEAALKKTENLIQNGSDVLYHATGKAHSGVMEAIDKYGVYGIGSDLNQDGLVKGSILTSIVKKLDYAIYFIISSFAKENLEARTYSFGLQEEGISLTDFEHTADIVGENKLISIKSLENNIKKNNISVL